jgi:hypothetical protein
MKELGLQDLLRYALSGGIWIASLLLMYPKVACSIGQVEGAREVTLVLGSVLLVGTIIYNAHRALLFPVLFRLIGLITLPQINRSWWLLFPWRPSEAELEVDRWRWRLKGDDRRRWDEWGAQTHFLYCAAWAIFAALAVGKFVGGSPSCTASHVLCVLFAITLIAGMVNNYRLLYSIASERKAH